MGATTSQQNTAKPMRAATADSRAEILSAAAECFKNRGYSATSIDDVARRLRATKGMIYHHFRSKTDLFCAVYQRSMEINFACVAPYLDFSGSALEKLARMSHAHAVTMMAHQAFQRTNALGVDMHRFGSTTHEQRETLDEFIVSRNEYEALFRQAIQAAVDECGLPEQDYSISAKSFLSTLNSSVFWYTPRQEDPREEQHELATELTGFALRGIGATPPEINYSNSIEGTDR